MLKQIIINPLEAKEKLASNFYNSREDAVNLIVVERIINKLIKTQFCISHNTIQLIGNENLILRSSFAVLNVANWPRHICDNLIQKKSFYLYNSLTIL
jgi:hypothetical protein